MNSTIADANVNWRMMGAAAIVGSITAFALVFPVIGILGLLGVVIDTAFNTGYMSLDSLGVIMRIVWLVSFVVLYTWLYEKQTTSQAAGSGFSLSAKLVLVSIPLIIVAMFTSAFPVSTASLLGWMIPIVLLAVLTGGLGVYFERRAIST